MTPMNRCVSLPQAMIRPVSSSAAGWIRIATLQKQGFVKAGTRNLSFKPGSSDDRRSTGTTLKLQFGINRSKCLFVIVDLIPQHRVRHSYESGKPCAIVSVSPVSATIDD